jgi:ribokinase
MVSYGGKGANQALAALKAGAAATFLAKIGTDAYGSLLYDHLVRVGFASEGLLRDSEAPAGIAMIAVDRTGSNQIIVAPGSNGRFTVEDLHLLEPYWQEASLLLTQLETPLSTVEHALRLAKSRGMTTILNPAPVVPLSPDFYPFVDILTPNEQEAGDLAGMRVETLDEAKKAAALLRAQGCRTVIITLGSQGALLSHTETVQHFPAFKVSAVDSVAAGDAFNGALAAALTAGKSLLDAICFANAAGALTTTRRGAQEALPTKKEIEQLLGFM